MKWQLYIRFIFISGDLISGFYCITRRTEKSSSEFRESPSNYSAVHPKMQLIAIWSAIFTKLRECLLCSSCVDSSKSGIVNPDSSRLYAKWGIVNWKTIPFSIPSPIHLVTIPVPIPENGQETETAILLEKDSTQLYSITLKKNSTELKWTPKCTKKILLPVPESNQWVCVDSTGPNAYTWDELYKNRSSGKTGA